MLALLTPQTHAQRTISASGGSLRLLQVSDTHHHVATSCDDVAASSPCTSANNTALLRSVVRAERPDLVAFTGDIIDGRSFPPRQRMDEIYATARDAHIPWAAIPGNHDDDHPTMSREALMDHLTNKSDTDDGSFYVDVTNSAERAVARLVFFGSTGERAATWFAALSRLPRVPALAFLHIPLPEYATAAAAGLPMSGSMLEPVSADSSRLFSVLRAGGVVAAFCGHDHANDWCVRWEGVQLCYGGSAGFTAYGHCSARDACIARRARVTELTLDANASLATVRSWKRVDGGGAVAARTRLDDEVLWSSA